MSSNEEFYKWIENNPECSYNDFLRMKEEQKKTYEKIEDEIVPPEITNQPIIDEQIQPQINVEENYVENETVRHSNKNIWGKGGLYEGLYKRHSVDKDVIGFAGWNKIDEIFTAIEKRTGEGWSANALKMITKPQVYHDVALFAFKLGARITEVLNVKKELFTIDNESDLISVRNFEILKRYKAVSFSIKCKRCKTISDQYETICFKCGANLVTAGQKKYITEHVTAYRLPFFIKISEKYSAEMIKLIENTDDGFLFPSPDRRRKGLPYSRGWAYNIVKDYGYLVGFDKLYNHWFRSQRLMQLHYEEHFTRDDLKVFTGIKADATIEHYVKDVQSYLTKLLGGKELSPEKFAELTRSKPNKKI